MIKTLVRSPEIVNAPASAEAKTSPRWSTRANALVFGSLVFVALVHLAGTAHNPTPKYDEGTYAAQAWALLHLDRLSPYTYWYDHPPLAWILLAGMWKLLGPLLPLGLDAVAQLRFAIWLFTLISLGSLVAIARRRNWHPLSAVAAVVLWVLAAVLF